MTPFLNSAGQIFIANITAIEENNQKIQQQLSSGHRVNEASDAPDEVSQLLGLQAALARNTSLTANLQSVQSQAQTADQALSQASQLINNVLTLGAEGSNSSETAGSRQQLAQQVQSIFNSLVSLSQTAVAGQYIFSGDSSTPQYQVDPASPNGVDRTSTAQNASQVEDPNGGLFPAGLTAEQIFDARNADDSFATGNVFFAVTSLVQALNNGDTSSVNQAVGLVQTAATFLNSQQSFYGTLENRITNSLSTASALDTSLKTQISNLRDTDVAQAAVELTQGQTELSAALESESKIPATSLFNYLG